MARKKAAASSKSRYVVDAGVGVRWETNKNGWGLERTPAVAVMHHPIKGMTVHGPFLDEDAAHTWVRNNGDAEVMDYYGDTSTSQWFVIPVYVPTHPKGE